MTENLTGYSYTQMREAAAAVEREVARREALDEAAKAEQFSTELAEIRAAGPVSGSKRRYKTLRLSPVARPLAPAESAARTDQFIARGMHPLAAYQASRQGVKPRKRTA